MSEAQPVQTIDELLSQAKTGLGLINEAVWQLRTMLGLDVRLVVVDYDSHQGPAQELSLQYVPQPASREGG